MPTALNRGFALARGELRTWISADNVCEPTMLARLVQGSATLASSVAEVMFRNVTTVHVNDDAGRLLVWQDPLARAQQYRYDERGRAIG